MKKFLSNVFLISTLVLMVISCKTSIEVKVGIEEEDAYAFKEVKIGNQIWMAENLNIPTNTGSKVYNNNKNYEKIYGRLYDWETANKLCPEGWRLPTWEDWNELITYYGGYHIAGKRLKSKLYWDEEKTGEIGDLLFNALPAGFYTGFEDGSYMGLKSQTRFWTAYERDEGHKYAIVLLSDSDEVIDQDHYPVYYHFSVRYIKE